MAGNDGMAGWTTSSAEEGGRTGLGEGERDDGADMAGRFGMDRLGLRDWQGFVTDRVLVRNIFIFHFGRAQIARRDVGAGEKKHRRDDSIRLADNKDARGADTLGRRTVRRRRP